VKKKVRWAMKAGRGLLPRRRRLSRLGDEAPADITSRGSEAQGATSRWSYIKRSVPANWYGSCEQPLKDDLREEVWGDCSTRDPKRSRVGPTPL